jgi:hypothetical protein
MMQWLHRFKCIYLGSEINSEEEISGKISVRIYNSHKFFEIIKGMPWNKRSPKEQQFIKCHFPVLQSYCSGPGSVTSPPPMDLSDYCPYHMPI